MKYAVRYYTKSGNTQKLAEAIANGLNVPALDVSFPLQESIDILFLGSSVYAAGIDISVKQFLENNASNIKMIVNFSTAAALKSTYKQVERIAQSLEIMMAEDEFYCRGSFGLFHKNHPNEEDL